MFERPKTINVNVRGGKIISLGSNEALIGLEH